MSKKSTTKTVAKITKRKTVAKKRVTARRITTKTTKPVLNMETPVVEVIGENQKPKTENQARPINIMIQETPPMSPYVIEFKTEDASISIADSPKHTEAISVHDEAVTHEPDFAALEYFMQEPTPEIIKKEKAANHIKTYLKTLWTRPEKPHPATDEEVARPTEDQKILTNTTEPVLELPRPEVVAPVTKDRTEKKQVKRVYKLNLTPLLRATAGFAILALIFTVPAASLSAYTKLEQTKAAMAMRGNAVLEGFKVSATTLDEFSIALDQATTEFTAAKTELEQTVGIFKTIMPLVPKAGGLYKSGGRLLDAGAHLTEAGGILTDGLAILTDAARPLGTRLINFEESMRAAFPLIHAAELELEDVSPRAVPEKIRAILPAITSTVKEVRASFAETLSLLPAINNFLGLEQTKRYLLVFQNQNELRPTGGFIGSFALLDLDRGEIKNLEIPGGGSYDLACCLSEHVIAPAPLHLIEPHWQFHDANWFPDFPTSAQKLMWFYNKSGGPTVDGVIAVNASIIPTLLETLGPIDLPTFNRTFTAANFIEETQKIVELEYDKEENKPKAVIGMLAPILLERLTTAEPDQLLSILSSLGQALQTKEIQIYAADPDTQKAFSEAGWTGEMKDTTGDYLMVVSANIAGGKTNAAMETEIHHRAIIQNDGTIIDRVDIIKTHHGQKGELFTGTRNVDFVRAYVPLGSRLMEAQGFTAPEKTLFDTPNDDYQPDLDLTRLVQDTGYDENSGTTIQTEQGKTVFGNWMQIDPGETRVASFTYLLPLTITPTDHGILDKIMGVEKHAPYTITFQPQSGARASWKSEVIVPPNITTAWRSANLESTDQGFQITDSLDRDMFAAILLK